MFAPGNALVLRPQIRRQSERPWFPHSKSQIAIAAKLRRRTLERMADSGQQRDQPNTGRSPFDHETQTQVHINAREDQVIANAIQDAAAWALAVGQARELPIRVVHRIGENVESHPDYVGREISIEIKMPCRNAGQGSKKSDRVWT